MMLRRLCDYYDRVASREIPFAHTIENISYVLTLDVDGRLVEIAPRFFRRRIGKKEVLDPQPLAVPRLFQPTSSIAPDFLWGKVSYVLGLGGKRASRTEKEHTQFVKQHLEWLDETNDPGLRSLYRFLEAWSPDAAESWNLNIPIEQLLLDEKNKPTDKNLVFEFIDDDNRLLHQREAAIHLWTTIVESTDTQAGVCLVTGQPARIVRKHPVVRGLKGQGTGAPLVSMKEDRTAFHSYGKTEAFNAPVGLESSFAYAAALSYLLRSENHVSVDDLSFVFWAERGRGGAEGLFRAALLGDDEGDDARDEKRVQDEAKIRDVLRKLGQGRPAESGEETLREQLDPKTRFFVAGLSPNEGRITVRLWLEDSLGLIAGHLDSHFQDLAIVPQPWRTLPAARRLLGETRAGSKLDNEKPHKGLKKLESEVMRAILTGGRHPRSLLANVVMRMRSDRDERDPRTNRVRWRAINGLRAAICKACLNRDARLSGRKEDVPVSLDKSNPNPGYRLGRLFAVLEAAQVAALGNLNATIRDRFYGAAAATPTSVFPLLMKNYKNHLKNVRIKRGERLGNWYEKRVGEIVDGLDGVFPRSLSLEDQGRFAIGYYHEREGVYRKRDPEAPDELKDADQADTPEDEE
jgi:CRISPR-associated protein Csd1